VAKNGISQTALAKATGVSGASISLMMKGDHYPSFEVFLRLAEVLEVSLDTLAGWEDGKPPLDIPTAPDVPRWLLPWLPALETLEPKGREAAIAFFKVLVPADAVTPPLEAHVPLSDADPS
jgi:transcriptional regulator with XRE-family HTH domain